MQDKLKTEDTKLELADNGGIAQTRALWNILLLYTNRQSFPFHAFHWWRTNHVRLTKSNCLPRISARLFTGE